jgi:hypothetical protein
MPVAQGSCPACGAPIEFGLGASVAKVCEFCKATVVRSDRGLLDMGKVAAIADTPSLIAVGDRGTLAGRPFEVLGRVQLDHGAGPWDEYYVAFDDGQNWGWLAYAQGRWHVTNLVAGIAVPAYGELQLEGDIALGQFGYFRVAEIKTATIRSAEGELPGAFPAGFVRYYADCYGQNAQFATLDYDDGSRPASVFAGYIFAEPQLVVTQLGPRSINKVRTTHLKCPNCGGEVPKLGGDRSERMGCPYCGAVSDIAEQKVISQQERLLEAPTIPIGSRGQFEGIEYLCLAYVQRSSVFDGETYSWEEFLIFAPAVGYRWLVDDPETGWSWAQAISPADVDLRGLPDAVGYLGKAFALRNGNTARVDYVLGEVYWKCAVGEVVEVQDFAEGRNVLSRELSPGEANWTYSVAIKWPAIAGAFSLPLKRPGGKSSAGQSSGLLWKVVVLLVILLICCIIGAIVNGDGSSSGTTTGIGSGVMIRSSGSSSSYRGGGVVSSGK